MIGIDIVELKRFETFLQKKNSLKKFLNDKEILLVKSSQTAAGFFAAKEAISKALGTGIGKQCSFKDIILYKDSLGAPYFTLSKEIISRCEITDLSLSISHDGGFVIAVAMIKSKNEPKQQLSH